MTLNQGFLHQLKIKPYNHQGLLANLNFAVKKNIALANYRLENGSPACQDHS